jgi:hypothetical protein
MIDDKDIVRITLSPELVDRCEQWAYERVKYLENELEKAVAAGDIRRASSLLCDLFGDDACCYGDHPEHERYEAAQAEIERRCAAVDPERYKSWKSEMDKYFAEVDLYSQWCNERLALGRPQAELTWRAFQEEVLAKLVTS